MKKPNIRTLKAEYKRWNELTRGNPMPEYHVLNIQQVDEDGEEDNYTTLDVDFHGRDTDWCALKLQSFPYLKKWSEADWANKSLEYSIENRHGQIYGATVEPWFIDEDMGLIYFKKVE